MISYHDDQNLYEVFEFRFAETADQTALRLADGQTFSYGEVVLETARMANALKASGVKPGDRVTVQVEKSPANMFVYLATLKCGAVYQPLNTAYTATELAYFIGDAEPAVIVCDPGKYNDVAAIARAQGDIPVLSLDAAGNGSLTTLAAEQDFFHETVARSGRDTACLLYTSGTTGRSKGAMITHQNLISNAVTLHKLWGFVDGDVLLHALPIYHVHGLQVALHTAFLNGSEILWHNSFDADAVLRDLPKASVMMGVPTFYTRLLAKTGFGPDATGNMRLFISGSAPLLAETHAAFEERCGHRILERYGMTETGMITSNPYDGERLAGTVGYSLPGVDIRIADSNGGELPRGDIGVVEVKGPNVFAGYWRMPEKTAVEFRADGYFITGDMGVQSADGRLSIVGRAKDLIISGGFNVYPKEVEAELDALPGVGESAVIGVAHSDFGEGVIAVITANGEIAEEAELIAGLKTRLAAFKVPKRILICDELPRNAMGKVQKAQLRKDYAEIFS